MCRSADVRLLDRDKIKIRAFSVKLTLAKNPCNKNQLPDSLTLVYLPRIVTGSGLEIDGSKIRPDSRAFVTLHRVVSGGDEGKVVSYVSKERVRAGEGVRYEVYLGDVKLLNGGFRRGDEDEEGGWRMGCRCLLEEELWGLDLVAAEVCVAAEGRVAVCERVEMVVRPRRRRRREMMRLEDIPETKEEEECSCCCCSGEEEGSGGDDEMMTLEEEEEMEGVGWAVDVGLWVMCLGVGLLVSITSSRRLRRRKFFRNFL